MSLERVATMYYFMKQHKLIVVNEPNLNVCKIHVILHCHEKKHIHVIGYAIRRSRKSGLFSRLRKLNDILLV